MPKRSLTPPSGGNMKKVEELNQAVDLMFSRKDGKPPQVTADLAPLVRIASELRDLPHGNFKARLKSELGRSPSMPTLAEPVTDKKTRTQPVAAPRLTFKDAAKAMEFYKNALAAREKFRFETPSGIGHAEMMIGDSVIMFGEEWPEGDRFSPETLGHSPVMMSLQVDDVDSFVERAAAAGMKIIMPPTDQFYGRRDANLLDPFGYTWSISTVKEEISLEEMQRRFREMMKGTEGGKLPEKGKRVNPIRPGFRTVTPYLIAENGPALLEFVKQAFGAEETFRTIGTAGGLHGEVRFGDSMLMIGGGIPGQEFRSTPNTHALHVYVPDCDAVYRQALAASATSIAEPRDQEYGERSGSIEDPAGNFWYVATAQGESYTPKQLHTVNPYLHPLRAEPVISFLKRAFNAQEIAKYASPDGVVHHAEIRVGDSVVEMGESHGKYQPMKSSFYLYVPNVDDFYRRALAAGASSLTAPADQPYGDRNAGVSDPFGNTWYIASHIKDIE
jgi:PhnB protein